MELNGEIEKNTVLENVCLTDMVISQITIRDLAAPYDTGSRHTHLTDRQTEELLMI